MHQKRTAGYGDRLNRALKEGPRTMSIRQLGAEMEERHPEMRGATYGGVRQYAAGNIQNPRVELLRAMADVLEVRADWLAFDDGPMTETEAAVEEDAETSTPMLADLLWGRFVEGCGFDPPRFLRALVPSLWLDMPALVPFHRLDPLEVTSRDRALDIAHQLGVILMAPLRAIGVDPEEMSAIELRSYVLAMIPGIRAAGEHIPTNEGGE